MVGQNTEYKINRVILRVHQYGYLYGFQHKKLLLRNSKIQIVILTLYCYVAVLLDKICIIPAAVVAFRTCKLR